MNKQQMDAAAIYWYARGYHDGRVVGTGVEEGYDAINGREENETDRLRHAYRQGYDCGVSDYCDLDEVRA